METVWTEVYAKYTHDQDLTWWLFVKSTPVHQLNLFHS